MQSRNFVNLNINPCKMCMPMGAVTAFKGIENSMIILHGSQGCSTYIRRHMAGHYNEPIDIASSSLNEEGTVYGGENNLKKGLRNLIKLYNPEIIGVATTCLAETIGEDIRRITAEFVEEENLKDVRIIPVATPGYGGTQFEGYFAALTSMVKSIARDTTPNGKLNIVAGSLNPGDFRNIRSILDEFKIDYTLLPDISQTLDGPYIKDYKKIPAGGTRVSDIEKMAGGMATIEMGLTVPENLSPGHHLQKEFGIPLYKCAIPMGLEYTDQFIELISKLSGKPVPNNLTEARGRLIDGMIDSHKYNGEGRAVIFGEPELALALSKLCSENGIKPVLVSTGTENTTLKQYIDLLETEVKPLVIDDTDFETIQRYAVELGANVLLGNSDGKVITEKEGIPLVRIGFPIHDRIGGQRQVYTGYNGSLKLLDDITNTLLEEKYEKYRKSMYDKYYKIPGDATKEENSKASELMKNNITDLKIAEKTKSHPCYSSGACSNARMHIPVAPACNITCNYCNRKFDCINESRPGVTSEVLTPEQAAQKFAAVKQKLPNLKVIGIAGPGDALANFENTKKSIELIKQIDPEITFCLSTNGLMLPYYADELIRLGVTHVTVTINAIDPKIGAKIYKDINFMGMRLKGEDAANLLLKNQLAGLSYLASKGAVCKVNIVMIKGINDHHIEDVVKEVKACGAYMTNIMPLIPAKGSSFENMPLTSNKELNETRKRCEVDLKQMYHCKQCRADAIGTLANDCSADFREKSCGGCSTATADQNKKSYTFAIASSTGMLIDEHFGHVEEFYIYRVKVSEISFIEKRQVSKYCTRPDECDNEENKIDRIVKTIEDCHVVLVVRIGYRPSKVLEEKGIKIVQTCGRIEEGINYALKELEEKVKEEIVC